MSRVVVFGLDHFSVGEFEAICDRGWMVYGSAATSGGGSTSITVSKEVLEKGWLQPGRMVLVEHPKLPAWAGVVDTPISLSAPALVSLYNAEYLLKLRTPDQTVKLTGTVAKVTKEMIALANAQEEMYLRMGDEGGSESYREETLDGRPFWDQLDAIWKRASTEVVFRADRNPTAGNRLYVHADLQSRTGIETNYLLVDGQDGNTRVENATLEREIWNRVIGINDANSAKELLTSKVYRDEASINAFGLRSKKVQFRVKVQSTLERNAEDYLIAYSRPVLVFKVRIMDVRDAFLACRPGNGVILHAANVVLPDGSRGWRGNARILAMAYNEQENSIGATLEAYYDV